MTDDWETVGPAQAARPAAAPASGADEWETVKAAPVAPAEQPDRGAIHAAGMGALQGATFGFWDELAAGARALVQGGEATRGAPWFGERYRTNLAQERADLAAAREQHPVASTLGNVAGGAATMLIPGAGMASLGRGFAANAVRGAGAGILTGAGESEAQDLGGIVKDAAKGGLVGGLVGGTVGTLAEKAVQGAQGRLDSRLLGEITGGRATTAGKKVWGNDELVTAAARKFGLDAAAKDAGQLAEATAAARSQVGEKLSAAYEAIDHEALGARVGDVRRAVSAVKAELQGPSEEPLRRQIDSYMEAVKSRWGAGARDRVPLQALNAEITALENVGFAGAELSPAGGAVLKRNLAGALEDVLQNRLEEIKDLGGKVARSALAQRSGWGGLEQAAEAAQALPGLNRDYRGLKLIQNIADQRASLPPASQAAGGLRNALGNTLDVGLAVTHPVAFVGKKLVEKTGPPLVNAADRALAQLVQASQQGRVTAQMLQAAIEVGVPRGLAERFATAVTSSQLPAAESSP